MAEIMTPEQLREYVRTMPDDEILRITVEYEEESDGREGEPGPV